VTELDPDVYDVLVEELIAEQEATAE